MYLTPRTHTIVATGRSRLWPGNSNNISALKNIWAQYLPHAESISASGILEEGTPPWGRAFVAPTADAVNYAPIIQQGTSTNEDNPPSARGLAWIHWIGLCIITPIIIIASVWLCGKQKEIALSTPPYYVETIASPNVSKSIRHSYLTDDFSRKITELVRQPVEKSTALASTKGPTKLYHEMTETHRSGMSGVSCPAWRVSCCLTITLSIKTQN